MMVSSVYRDHFHDPVCIIKKMIAQTLYFTPLHSETDNMTQIAISTHQDTLDFLNYQSSDDVTVRIRLGKYFTDGKAISDYFETLAQNGLTLKIVELFLMADNPKYHIETLDYLRHLPSLTSLEIYSSASLSLAGIELSSSLKKLRINCRREKLDLRGIEFVAFLEDLRITSNEIINPYLINHLTALRELALHDITTDHDIELSDFHSLKVLKIRHSSVGRIIFPSVSGLEYINLSHTKFKGLVGIKPACLIKFLAQWCELENLAFLEGAVRLKHLMVCGNPFTDLSQIQGLISLERVCVVGSPVLTTDVCKNAAPMGPGMALWLHSLDVNPPEDYHDQCCELGIW